MRIFLRDLSMWLGLVWLSGQFVPHMISRYIEISELSDRHVFIIGILLMIYMKVADKIFGNCEDT